MRSEYIREQRRYSRKVLMDIFLLNTEEFASFIKKLKTYGVLKMVKATSKEKDLADLTDEEIEIVDVYEETDDYYYVFTFVGILTVGNRIIKCFPKYLQNKETPLIEMKQILKVLDYYNSKEQIINLFNGDGGQSAFNLLAVILYLLNDYHENGVYTNQKDIIEINGDGEILWDNTINETYAIISNNRPLYIELRTINTVNDEMDYFKRLHQCILTECSKKLEDADLLEIFEINSVVLSDEELADFGDIDYILYRLQRELNVQFVTRKQRLLKTLYAYVAHSKSFEDSFGLSMYGTNSFNLVWEKVCSEVFNNKLSTPIGQLDLPVPLAEGYKSNKKLIDIIEKPLWVGFDDENKAFEKNSKDTLTPDLISVSRHEENIQFIIFDAKYYNIQLEKGKELRGYPGIADVTKQYLYQLAYKKFIEDHKIKIVRNCFLMPSPGDNIVKKGNVKMQMLKNLDLQDIKIRLLPAKMMYEKYLSRKIMNVGVLEL